MGVYKSILVLHIIFGGLALICGASAILARKGSATHINAGRVYYYNMWAVALSAFTMTIMKSNPFLFAIAVFALYLTHEGRTALVYYRLSTPYPILFKDKLPSYAGTTVGLFMLVFPFYPMLKNHVFTFPVLSVFGTILLVLSSRQLARLHHLKIIRPFEKRWLFMHLGMMSGAYIATVTAFLLNNLTMNPPWVLWLAPTAVGLPTIVYATKRWAKKLKI